VRAGEPPVERRTIRFDYGRTKKLGGIDVPSSASAQSSKASASRLAEAT